MTDRKGQTLAVGDRVTVIMRSASLNFEGTIESFFAWYCQVIASGCALKCFCESHEVEKL